MFFPTNCPVCKWSDFILCCHLILRCDLAPIVVDLCFLLPQYTHETSGAPKRFSMNFPCSSLSQPHFCLCPLDNRYLSLKHDVIHHTHNCNYNTKIKVISGSILKGSFMNYILWPLCCCLLVPCYIKQNLKKISISYLYQLHPF